MQRISASQSETIRELRDRLGDRTFRTIFTPRGRRLLRPIRMQNLLEGRGKLSESELARLEKIQNNSRGILALKSRGKREYDTNQNLRIWLESGKQAGQELDDWKSDYDNWYDVFDALDYFDIEPDDDTPYIEGK